MTNNHDLITDHARLEAETAALRAQIEQLPQLIMRWNREITRGEIAERCRPSIQEVIELWRREVAK